MSNAGVPLPPYYGADDDDDVGLSVLAPLNFVLRHRTVLVLAAVLGVSVGLIRALSQARWYEASVSFVTNPGTGRLAAGSSGTLPQFDQSDPFDYYSRILASTVVMDGVLNTKLAAGDTVRERISPDDSSEHQQPASDRDRLLAAGARLDSTNRLRRWDVVSVMTVRAGWTDPQTAADVTNAYFESLAEFDKQIRSSAAKARRDSIQKQVGETKEALKTAEDNLRVFKEENRLLLHPSSAPSATTLGELEILTRRPAPTPPQLEVRLEQLQREVNLQAELYTTLQKAYEDARIAQENEAMLLVMIEEAVPPRSPAGPSRRRTLMVNSLIGLAAGLVLAGIFELRSRLDLQSPEAVELVGHLQTIRHDVAKVGARTMKALSPPPPPAGHQESKRDV